MISISPSRPHGRLVPGRGRLCNASGGFRIASADSLARTVSSRAEGKGLEPSSARGGTALAKRPGQPYPATFRFVLRVDRRGIEPRFPGCKPGVFPLDQQPSEIHLSNFHPSDRGGNRTHKFTRLSTSPLFLFAYPASMAGGCVPGPHGRALRYRGPSFQVAGPGVAPGGGAYETPLGHWPTCDGLFQLLRMTKGRFELPCPKARRSERRVSAVPPLGLQCSCELTRAGIEPAFAA